MSTNGNGNGTALIVFQHQGLVVTKEERDTLVGAISTQNPTDAELKLYFYDCARRGVHPLDKLIHFTKRQGRYTPVVSIDYMRMRAESSGVYAGSDEPVFEEAEGDPYPISAKVTVYKMVNGQRCPFTGKVLWKEIAPDTSGNAGFMWKKMPLHMLAKCAEAQALRKAFPGQLHGLYEAAEMDQAGPLDGNAALTPEQALLQGKRRLVEELAGKYTAEEIGATLKELGKTYTVETHDEIRAALETHWDMTHDVVDGQVKVAPNGANAN